ncbi:hypothetical protein DL93DRAFT_970857 [Clavulina sp. PMI_390]|nr:hypothetical protein DL93DRAFT_970857 [Clavulina sp. PMI_390]
MRRLDGDHKTDLLLARQMLTQHCTVMIIGALAVKWIKNRGGYWVSCVEIHVVIVNSTIQRRQLAARITQRMIVTGVTYARTSLYHFLSSSIVGTGSWLMCWLFLQALNVAGPPPHHFNSPRH